MAPTPADAAKNADVVLVCVGNDDDVRAVVLGENGALASMKPGAILVDHTTASAELARDSLRQPNSKVSSFWMRRFPVDRRVRRMAR